MDTLTKAAVFAATCVFGILPAMGQLQQKRDPKDIADVTIRTGAQVKPLVYDLLEKDENVKAAGKLFQDRDRELMVNLDGLVAIQFLTVSSKERYELVYIPYSETKPQLGQLRLTVWTRSPKATRVWAVVANIEGPDPVIKEDYAVANGKAEPDKGKLKEWFKCLIAGCGPALAGCAYGDGVYAQCALLWCGGAAASCALLFLF